VGGIEEGREKGAGRCCRLREMIGRRERVFAGPPGCCKILRAIASSSSRSIRVLMKAKVLLGQVTSL
jgi:hypothetical protein